MSFTSWLSKPQQKQDAVQKGRDRQARRQPTYARPSLEYLEERTLLDASTSPIGVILPSPGPGTGAAVANGANPATAINFSSSASGGSSALAATSAFLAQSQGNSQFRLFAANSQGANYSLSQQTPANILFGVNGFGSGTAPNAPWRPNAYNLGLANRAFNYSSQSDFGFQPVAPWTVPVAQTQSRDQLSDQSEEADLTPEQGLMQKSTDQQEQTENQRMDEDTGDSYLLWKALLEKSASEKEHRAEQAQIQESNIPEEVWLSVLSQGPMAALAAGLPGMAGAAECGDSGATEGGDCGAGARE